MKTYSRTERRRKAEATRIFAKSFEVQVTEYDRNGKHKGIGKAEKREELPVYDTRYVSIGGPSGLPDFGGSIADALGTFGVNGSVGKLGMTDGEAHYWPIVKGAIKLHLAPYMTDDDKEQAIKLSHTIDTTKDSFIKERAIRLLNAIVQPIVVNCFNDGLGKRLARRELAAFEEMVKTQQQRERLANIVPEVDKVRGRMEAEKQLERRIADGRIECKSSASNAGASYRAKMERREYLRKQSGFVYTPSVSSELETGVNLAELVKAKADRTKRK